MFLERFKEVENFTITKLPLGESNRSADNIMDHIYQKLYILLVYTTIIIF